jgi:DNA polymerase-3 subunit epsilon
MVDLSAAITAVPLAFLDVETTGLRAAYGDRVCEVAILRVENGEAVDALQRLVNPQRPMGEGAYRIHGISDEMVADAPAFAEIAPDVLALLEGAVFVGHNAPFDLGFIAAELALAHAALPPLVALDTLRLTRSRFALHSYALGNVAAALGADVHGQAHRAMVDVLFTRYVFERLIENLGQAGVHTVGEFVAVQGGAITTTPFPNIEVPPLIQEAVRRETFLYLRYLAENGQETERMVRPIAVFERDGSLFLLAHCLLRDARRTFRLDRVLDIDLVDRFE